jgi:hypothetical protein
MMPSVSVRTMVACGVEQNDILEPNFFWHDFA